MEGEVRLTIDEYNDMYLKAIDHDSKNKGGIIDEDEVRATIVAEYTEVIKGINTNALSVISEFLAVVYNKKVKVDVDLLKPLGKLSYKDMSSFILVSSVE